MFWNRTPKKTGREKRTHTLEGVQKQKDGVNFHFKLEIHKSLEKKTRRSSLHYWRTVFVDGLLVYCAMKIHSLTDLIEDYRVQISPSILANC